MPSTMNPEELQQLRELLRTGRWAAIATARDNEPLASWEWQWPPRTISVASCCT